MTPSTRIPAAALIVAVAAGVASPVFAAERGTFGLRLGAGANVAAHAEHDGRRLGTAADAHATSAAHHDGSRAGGFFHRLRNKGLGVLHGLRGDLAQMTPEERAALRDDATAFRTEQRAAWESFLGTDAAGLKDARKNGDAISDVIASQGHDRADTEAFLDARADDRIGFIDAHHDLTADQETTLRARFSAWVDRLCNRWFG